METRNGFIDWEPRELVEFISISEEEDQIDGVLYALRHAIQNDPYIFVQPMDNNNGNIFHVFIKKIANSIESGSSIRSNFHSIKTLNMLSMFILNILARAGENGNEIANFFRQTLTARDNDGLTPIDYFNNLLQTVKNRELAPSTNPEISVGMQTLLEVFPRLIFETLTDQQMEERVVKNIFSNAFSIYRQIRGTIQQMDLIDNFNFIESLHQMGEQQLQQQRAQNLRQATQQISSISDKSKAR